MGRENSRQEHPRKEVVGNCTVDHLIELSREGKIEWDFSRMNNVLGGCSITTQVGRFKVISYDEQDTGPGLKIGRVKENSVMLERTIEFDNGNSRRLREFLEKLALEDPVAIEVLRRQAEELKEEERKAAERRAEEARRLRKINEQLRKIL